MKTSIFWSSFNRIKLGIICICTCRLYIDMKFYHLYLPLLYALFISFHIDPFEILEFPNTLSEYEQGLNTCTWYMGSFNCITHVLKRVNLYGHGAKKMQILPELSSDSDVTASPGMSWKMSGDTRGEGRIVTDSDSTSGIPPKSACNPTSGARPFSRGISTPLKKRWKISLVQ